MKRSRSPNIVMLHSCVRGRGVCSTVCYDSASASDARLCYERDAALYGYEEHAGRVVPPEQDLDAGVELDGGDVLERPVRLAEAHVDAGERGPEGEEQRPAVLGAGEGHLVDGRLFGGGLALGPRGQLRHLEGGLAGGDAEERGDRLHGGLVEGLAHRDGLIVFAVWIRAVDCLFEESRLGAVARTGGG